MCMAGACTCKCCYVLFVCVCVTVCDCVYGQSEMYVGGALCA